jgi:mannose-6-phosphate isomerase-like protein (cupin superfamily)
MFAVALANMGERRRHPNLIVSCRPPYADPEPLEKGEQMPLIKADGQPSRNVRGAEHGASISLILDHSEPGEGPRLHRHPYDETWVVIDGNLTFQAGDDQLDAGPGDIVLVPPDTPHKFVNHGTRRANLVCIHANPTFETQWLE